MCRINILLSITSEIFVQISGALKMQDMKMQDKIIVLTILYFSS